MLTRRTALSALLGTPLAAPAIASPWRPDRPVEFTVGFAAGGGTDIVARLFARFLQPKLGVPVTVVNRTGAGSELGMTHVARSRPDGHTIGLTNMPAFVTIPIERRAQYNLDSFAFVGGIMNDPTGIVTRDDGPFRDLPGLIAAARARPEDITVSTSGIGTDDHLLMAMISAETGARFTLVHFNGAPIQRNNLFAGNVQVNTMSVGEVMPNPERLRFVGHGGRERSRFAPQVPTLRELGLNIEMYSERGIVLPAGTSSQIVDRYRDAVAEAAADPATLAAFEAQFIAPNYEPGAVFEARMRSVQERYAELWRRAPWINA
jgi:tripartite-type tricarboxylate transporter receptor subunit TctC